MISDYEIFLYLKRFFWVVGEIRTRQIIKNIFRGKNHNIRHLFLRNIFTTFIKKLPLTRPETPTHCSAAVPKKRERAHVSSTCSCFIFCEFTLIDVPDLTATIDGINLSICQLIYFSTRQLVNLQKINTQCMELFSSGLFR